MSLQLLKLFSRLGVNAAYRTIQISAQPGRSQRFPTYVKLHFHEVKASHPGFSAPDVMRKLGEMYRSLSAADVEKIPVDTVPFFRAIDESDRNELRKKLALARKHGLPRSLPTSAYKVYIADKLTGNRGSSLKEMSSKLSELSKSWKSISATEKETLTMAASENKLAHLRLLKKWAEDHQIQFSKRESVLASRFYNKHQRETSKIREQALKQSDKKITAQ